jgi:acyl-CoA thioesterase-1
MREAVLVLGDSVTVGAGFSGVDESTAYVSLLQDSLDDSGLQVTVSRSAIDGVDTGYALRRFDRMVGRERPHIVVVALGLNDAQPPGGRAGCEPAQYRDNLCRIAEKVIALDAFPVFATPSPRIDVQRDDAPARHTMEPYAEQVRNAASQFGAPTIDLYNRFFDRRDLEALLPDRLHPGPEGHRIIADAFAETLVPLCRSRARTNSARDTFKAPFELNFAEVGELAGAFC